VQWLKMRQDKERGGVAVIVALLMVVLLGFTAIAVDVGMLYSEKAQLQNGADAAALMVAQKCAKNVADAQCSTTSTLAASIVNGNALDNRSNVKSLVLDKANRTVTVTAGAQEQGKAPNTVTLFFAKALGITSAEVNASASVIWGTPSKGRLILPLAIPQCKLNLAPGSAAGAEQVLDMDSGGCGEIPGGFSWIEDGDGKCGVTAAAGLSNNPGIWFTSNTGASVPAPCTDADVSTLNDQTVLLPLYDLATGNGSSGKYYVKGFAAFHVTGYHFESHSWTSGGNIKNKTIRGYFVRFVSLSDALELGSTPDYGATVVRISQ
jgi:Flp pilus assembly protein TadG